MCVAIIVKDNIKMSLVNENIYKVINTLLK